MNKSSIILILLMVHMNCRSPNKCYEKVMDTDQNFHNFSNGIFAPPNLPIFDFRNQEITLNEFEMMEKLKFDLAEIVDCKGKIVRLQVVYLDENRKILRSKIDSLMRSNFDLHVKLIKFRVRDTAEQLRIIKLIEKTHVLIDKNVDCSKVRLLLEQCFTLDQSDRNNRENDMKNIRVVESLFQKCGWSSIENLGKESIYQVFILVQHSNLSLMQKYLPYFKESVEKGFLDKSNLALMIDRIEVSKGNPQIFGTQFKRKDSDGSIILEPIKNIEKIDSIRASFGLNTLNEYLQFIKEK